MKTKGGDFLGKGSYGCVFSPPIQCNDNRKTPTHGVGKVIFSKIEAEKEWNNANKVFEFDRTQKWFLYVTEQCSVDRSAILQNKTHKKCAHVDAAAENSTFTQHIQPNGGVKIGEFLANYSDSLKLSRVDIVQLIDNIFRGVQQLIKHDLIHQDLTLNNVVASLQNRSRIIDIGMMLSKTKFYNLSDNGNFMLARHMNYYSNPNEYNLLFNNKIGNLDNISQDNKNKILNSLYTEKTDTLDLNINNVNLLAFYKFYDVGLLEQREEYFDFLKKFYETNSNVNTRIEYMKKINIHQKSDVYSLGIIMLSLSHYIKSRSKETDKRIVDLYRKLIRGLLHPSPIHRLDIDAALKLIKEIKSFTTSDIFKTLSSQQPIVEVPMYKTQGIKQYIFDKYMSRFAAVPLNYAPPPLSQQSHQSSHSLSNSSYGLNQMFKSPITRVTTTRHATSALSKPRMLTRAQTRAMQAQMPRDALQYLTVRQLKELPEFVSLPSTKHKARKSELIEMFATAV